VTGCLIKCEGIRCEHAWVSLEISTGLSDGSGCSGYTYTNGVLRAIERTKPSVFFWENVTTVLEGTPAQVDNIKRDMNELGYLWEVGRTDARDFLLRQRRNRVYGTADLNSGQSEQVYQARMAATMNSMKSDINFPFDAVFNTALSCEKPRLRREQLKVEEAVRKGMMDSGCSNMFVDTSTSESRMAECVQDVLPCIRPTHPIYSQKLCRYVTVEEMWKCQGLWTSDFDNPSAVTHMLSIPKQAQDLCGNAFASTCCQAKLLASMVHSKGWSALVDVHGEGKREAPLPEPAGPMRRVRGKTNPEMQLKNDGKEEESLTLRGQKRKFPGCCSARQVRHTLQESSARHGRKERKKYADGRKIKRPGKRFPISVFHKVELFKAAPHKYVLPIIIYIYI
jgi:site-specific DNA-cytosine methylase